MGERTEAQLSYRIGLSTGSIVGGIIGTTNFTFDLWGDTMVPHHPRCEGRPERCGQSGGRQLTITGFAVALPKVKEELVASGFSGKGFALYGVL